MGHVTGEDNSLKCVISLERLRTLDSSESALAALRRYISRPAAIFDKYEAVELLQSLLRLARNENHQKADEHAAALDDIKTRSDFVDDQQLQRLFLGLLGDPVRTKVANFEGSRKGRSTSHACSSWFYDAQASPLPWPCPGSVFQVLKMGTYRSGVPCPNSRATVWSWSCWTIVSYASVYNKFLFSHYFV